MQDYRVETTIANDSSPIIKELPFKAGDKVEIIMHPQEHEQDQSGRYPLRGKPIRYSDPFESVAENE